MKGLLLVVLSGACALGLLGAAAPSASAGPPSISLTGPAAAFYVAGQPVLITWNLSDDHDPVAELLVWVNYTGPASGAIAGPLSGSIREVLWTIPSSLTGNGYRITAVAVDPEGLSQSAEGPEFAILALPKAPAFPLGASGAEIGVASLVVGSGFLVFLIAAFGPALAGRVGKGGARKVRAARRRTGLRPIPWAEWEAKKARGGVPAHSRSQYGGGRKR